MPTPVKIRIKFIVALIATAIALDRGGYFLLNAITIHSHFRLSTLYAGKAGAQVLLVGDSRAEHFVKPSAFKHVTNKTLFNGGLNGLNIKSQNAIVRDYLDKNDTPSFLLIEASNVIWPHDMFAYSAYWHWSKRLHQLGHESSATPHWKEVFKISRFDWDSLARILYYLCINNEQELTPIDGLVNAEVIEAFRRREQTFDVDGPGLMELRNLITDTQQRDITVLVFIAPIHPSLWNHGWDAAVSALRSEISGEAIVHDWSHELPDDQYFVDPVHINQRGRQAMLSHLGQLAFSEKSELRYETRKKR